MAAATTKNRATTKSRMDKLGVKGGMRVAVMGLKDPTLSAELAEMGAEPVTELANLDLLFYAADSAEALARVGALAPMLSETGALWIVSAKGKTATVKGAEVIEAAQARGLTGGKLVAFSPSLTSLRFTRAKAEPVTEPLQAEA
jgi:hypothetical protein